MQALWLDFMAFYAWARQEKSCVWKTVLQRQEELSHVTSGLQEADKRGRKWCSEKLSLNQGIVGKIESLFFNRGKNV